MFRYDRFFLPLLLLAACTPGPTGSPSPASGGPSQPTVGAVDLVQPVAYLRDVEEATIQAVIREKDTITTEATGSVSFHTNDVKGCVVKPHSKLRVRPDENVVIAFLAGESWCSKDSLAEQVYKIGENNDPIGLTMEDPIFGVVFEDNGISVKVADGSVSVRVGRTSPFRVAGGQEAFVPVEGPAQVRPIRLTQEQRRIIDDLQLPPRGVRLTPIRPLQISPSVPTPTPARVG